MVHITNWQGILNYIIASYGKENRNSSIVLNALNEGVGEAFTSPLTRVRLTDVVFLLQRNAAFVAPGTVEARLYRVLAGTTVGTTAVPDIVAGPLATSTAVVAANIPLAWGLVNFNFPIPSTLDPELGYVIVIVATNVPAGQVEVGIDTTTVLPPHIPTYLGNETNNITAPPIWTPNPLNDVIFYLFSYSNVLAGGVVDVSDRAARLLGIIYGDQAPLQQVPVTLELITQDTGVNTNPERWLHENHWEADEVSIVVAGVGGQQNLGVAVPAGATRRIRELTIRNPRTDNVVITLLVAGGATKVTIDVPAQATRVWSSQDGREFDPAEQPAVQSSVAAAAPNDVLVSASGVEQ